MQPTEAVIQVLWCESVTAVLIACMSCVMVECTHARFSEHYMWTCWMRGLELLERHDPATYIYNPWICHMAIERLVVMAESNFRRANIALVLSFLSFQMVCHPVPVVSTPVGH
jgi:hypothetical protein